MGFETLESTSCGLKLRETDRAARSRARGPDEGPPLFAARTSREEMFCATRCMGKAARPPRSGAAGYEDHRNNQRHVDRCSNPTLKPSPFFPFSSPHADRCSSPLPWDPLSSPLDNARPPFPVHPVTRCLGGASRHDPAGKPASRATDAAAAADRKVPREALSPLSLSLSLSFSLSLFLSLALLYICYREGQMRCIARMTFMFAARRWYFPTLSIRGGGQGCCRQGTANPRAKDLDFGGFDSGRFLILKVGNPGPARSFPEI